MHLNTQLQPKPKFQKCICRRKISYALGYEVAHQTPPELDINSFVTVSVPVMLVANLPIAKKN
jgi:hypothetical protein